jgi:hypothetical protein
MKHGYTATSKHAGSISVGVTIDLPYDLIECDGAEKVQVSKQMNNQPSLLEETIATA